MRLVQALALSSVLLLTTSAYAQDLDLDAGTMQLGGAASFNINMSMPDVGDSTSGMSLTLVPTFGYFILDNLELNVDLSVGLYMGDLYDNPFYPTTVGFGLGARYFIPMGAFAPYGGLRIEFAVAIPDEGDSTKALGFTVPLGLLIPLNEQVALDAGMRIRYDMSLEDGGGAFLAIPIGYFGVQAFF